MTRRRPRPAFLPGLGSATDPRGAVHVETFDDQGADSDEFYTPRWLVQALPPIDLDPCSPPHRPIPARDHVVGAEGGDGLAATWRGLVFMNPPYSRGNLPLWTARAATAVRDGEAQAVIGLIPARPESAYWWANVWPSALVVGWVDGRICFEDAAGLATDNTAKLGSALVVWARTTELAERIVLSLGRAPRRVRWTWNTHGATPKWTPYDLT